MSKYVAVHEVHYKKEIFAPGKPVKIDDADELARLLKLKAIAPVAEAKALAAGVERAETGQATAESDEGAETETEETKPAKKGGKKKGEELV